MSRTYRRLDCSWMKPNYVDSIVSLKRIDGKLYSYDTSLMRHVEMYGSRYIQHTPSRAVKVQETRLHGDFDLGWNAPSRFRRCINRTYRRKSNSKLKKHIIENSLDDVIIDKSFRDANHHYF